MSSWFFALAVKMIAAPIVVFCYWALTIKLPNVIKRYFPEGRLKDLLFREHYWP